MLTKYKSLKSSVIPKLERYIVKDYKEARRICNKFGTIIHENDVSPDQRSRSLTNSFKSLDFHTDHHKAKLVGLYCITPAKIGGENAFIDIDDILVNFTKQEIGILQTISLKEHNIFEGDTSHHPMLTIEKGEYSIYYSYWLSEELSPEQEKVFRKFRDITKTVKRFEIKLKKNELLIFDNRRILHSRREIQDGENRLLKRIWLG